MSFGIIEAITLLLGMAGFGLQANPKAPTAEQALRYAVADADIVAHIDATSVVPGNYKLLGQLADQPQIKASPELQKVVREAIGEIEGARGVARLATGLDVTSDIADATAFVRIVAQEQPSYVIAVHGKFSAANLDKIARMAGGSAAKLGTGTIVETGPHEPAVGLTRDGVLLVGTVGLVRDRLADGWAPPSHEAGTNLGLPAEVIGGKPVLAVVLALSQAARGELLKALPSQGFATDLVSRHKAAAFSMFHDGIGWTWIDSSKAGVDGMELVSNGMLDMLRAAQIAPRGIAKIVLGALDSYHGASPQVDDLIKHKADLMKIVESYTGDGTFKAVVDKNPRTLRLNVRATGKSLSDVVPLGLLLPAAVVGMFEARAVPEAPEMKGDPLREPARPAPVAKPPVARPPATRPPVKRP